jgi:hypothetical protein
MACVRKLEINTDGKIASGICFVIDLNHLSAVYQIKMSRKNNNLRDIIEAEAHPR